MQASHSQSQKCFDHERPRERCLRDGPGSLSLRECFALLIGTAPSGTGGAMGVAEVLLSRAFPLARDETLNPVHLERAFFEAWAMGPDSLLAGLHGLGEVGRSRILAALELGRRYAVFRMSQQRESQTGPIGMLAQQPNLDSALRYSEKEWIGFFPVSARGVTGDFCLVERGTRTHVNLDPAEFFQRLLSLRTKAFILAHNHPSGDPRPSACDLDLTFRIRATAEALGIRLLGHWIVVPNGQGSWVGREPDR